MPYLLKTRTCTFSNPFQPSHTSPQETTGELNQLPAIVDPNRFHVPLRPNRHRHRWISSGRSAIEVRRGSCLLARNEPFIGHEEGLTVLYNSIRGRIETSWGDSLAGTGREMEVLQGVVDALWILFYEARIDATSTRNLDPVLLFRFALVEYTRC